MEYFGVFSKTLHVCIGIQFEQAVSEPRLGENSFIIWLKTLGGYKVDYNSIVYKFTWFQLPGTNVKLMYK